MSKPKPRDQDKLYYLENGLVVFTEAYHLKEVIVARADADIVPMISKKKVTISWSGGKDSAFALYKILESGEFDVSGLHTVIDKESRRVGLHGVRESLIEKQAEQFGLPLQKMYLQASNDHELYKTTMQEFYQRCSVEGIDGVVFGDIFLEDLKDFRIALLAQSGLTASFPLWMMNSKVLIREFIQAGFQTTLCAADAKFFSPDQLGLIDDEFLRQLPAGVDPCGEHGEFHTFVFDGPLFKKAISILKGEVVKRTYTYQTKEPNGEVKNLNHPSGFRICIKKQKA